MARRLFLILAVVGCGSITLQDNAPVPINVPVTWSASHVLVPGGNTLLALWWRHFDDPLLGSLVEQALLANTRVRSAQAALRQARALRDVSAAGLLPALGSSASAQQSRTDGNSNGDSFKAGLDASWELDIFGTKRNALAAGEATTQACAASRGDVQVSPPPRWRSATSPCSAPWRP